MLESLYIRNYRNLKELRINSLNRVNLITGRNNTGKSTILEAVAIYAAKGDLNLIYQLLGERGEIFKQTEANKNPTEFNLKSLSSLFTNRLVGFEKTDAVSIGQIENILLEEWKPFEKSVSLGFVRFIDEFHNDDRGALTIRKRTVLDGNTGKQLGNFRIGIEIRVEGFSFIVPLDEDRPHVGYLGLGDSVDNFQFIRTRNIDREINSRLWDNITLTDKEKYVIEALKIIEPSTERIAFIEENPRERSAVIKLSNNSSVLPLRSMGDGINRILTIVLALINSDNGFLLIDEFENGLHYTVQEQLWTIIFTLAKKLNVQIFATTHSEDCISGFETVLNSMGNPQDGKLIRLDNVNGVIKQVEFNAHELKIANDQSIETR